MSFEVMLMKDSFSFEVQPLAGLPLFLSAWPWASTHGYSNSARQMAG